MKLNKKGFTLVELLAVIVVLAIIALIGYTAVGPIITNSRNSAAENNILQYEHALEIGCAAYQALHPEATSISLTDAISLANFKGTPPTKSGGADWALSISDCSLTVPTMAESNGISCKYSSSAGWSCGS